MEEPHGRIQRWSTAGRYFATRAGKQPPPRRRAGRRIYLPIAHARLQPPLILCQNPYQAMAPESAQTFSPEPFLPRRLFRGGHAQTIVGNFMRRQNLLPPAEERLFDVEPGIQVLCHCHWQPDRTLAMTAIVVHGLEG